jgi:lipopolysaccharide transport system permease protein
MSMMHNRILPPKKIELLNLPELWRYRDLLWTLAQRDIKLRYRQTFLGVVWVIIQPLFTSAVFAIVFGRLGNLPSESVPYEVLTFVALLPWNLVSQAITRASGSLVRDMRMVTRVFFPRIIIPIASSVSALIDFGISCIVLLVILAIYDLPLSARALFVPAFGFLAWLVSLSVSVLIAAFNVYYRDFQYAVAFALQGWMYLSPVAYSISLVPEHWRLAYALNPIVGLVEAFKWMLIPDYSFPASALTFTLVFVAVFIPVSILVFQRIEKYFADVI